MGRAIDMEKDISKLKIEIERLKNTLRGVCVTMDEMKEKTTKTTHIDLVDDVKKKGTENGKKKANDKGTSKSIGNSKSGHGNSEDEDNKSGKSSS